MQVVIAEDDVPRDRRQLAVLAVAIWPLRLELSVRVEFGRRSALGRAVVRTGQRLDEPAVKYSDQPVQFVRLDIITSVAGVNEKVDRPAAGVDAIGGSVADGTPCENRVADEPASNADENQITESQADSLLEQLPKLGNDEVSQWLGQMLRESSEPIAKPR